MTESRTSSRLRIPLYVVTSIVLALGIFVGGAYWGSYQLANALASINNQNYFDRTFVEQMMMIGALRNLDAGEVEYARETLKSFEDQLISTIDVSFESYDDESFKRACRVMQDIAVYRQDNADHYAVRPSPIDDDLGAILQKWRTMRCTIPR